jgi:hypothetical protein
MHPRNVMIRSAISGAIWSGIAILLMMAAGGRFDEVGRIAWGLRGGIVAAPFIGIAVGACWRAFRDSGLGRQIVISLATLYIAAFLFMLAAGLTAFAAGELRHGSLSRVFFDSWNAAIAGLTWTGFVLVVGPLAFLNHLWVARVGTARCGRE